ncbi:Transcription initiation factor TFIID subunit 2 [Penicillium ucsense]|uniref:Transcription initiation factor TFIID subunit 2 n=1 Tax=Penicillium ucsense TaxID=2839758 RepID=A0A8J8W247_9EURO|nr:Transcription initiation factor TFIID subunit 2 [Penicillium ucsense]KAF7736568.1 Transcription initiation factor TFIID subunit 2 [Penicillium ucsense]
MPGVVEVPAAPQFRREFNVGQQKVHLEIDFANKSLKGSTDITVYPSRLDLRSVHLNFRQGEIKRLTVNSKPATLKYVDPYDGLHLYGPHYHERLTRKTDGLLKIPPDPQIEISIPKNVHIRELDARSTEARERIALQSTGDDVDGPSGSKAPDSNLPQFSALTLHIEFVIERIRDGVQFVGVDSGDRRYPHAYTTNSQESSVGCPLFPCVDDPSSRCAWEISISCPASLGDLFDRKGASSASRTKANSRYISADDGALDMSVVCSGELTDDITDPKDSTRKTVSFACYTPLSARQIGFAVGPFEYVNLADFRESDQDEQLGQNAIPVHAFCLPGRADEVQNTGFPMAQAIDFFSLSYGSYPFSSYKMCFVDDVATETLPSAGMSICSSHLLFPSDIIDPMYDATRCLVHALACQWSGINIIPCEPADTWVTVGVAWFITDTFMKKLCGTNEYRYRLKQMSDRICDLDYERPSIYDMGNFLKIDPSEYQFIALKAPLVLFILDRRLTKASGKATMSRIISRLFLNSRMGDIPNSAVTSAMFQRLCERFGHAKLDIFFSQWVYGAGCPRFQATQRFNKKKLVVEMMIRQVQSDQTAARDLDKDAFLRDVKEEIRHVYAGPIQPVFTGSMTIRIHEADGTPYEHIVEIKEGVTKFDIPYNTKYKRLKRNKKQRERAVAAGDAETQEEVLLYCLGDVLQTEEETQAWRLADWTKEDEERMGQESYEWIRMDADFEWICKLSLGMPGYMYLSQLQQDRDVVAQLESLQYMAAQREHPLISTIFARTLMDSRYFHGIRVTAAKALVKHAKDEVDWIGLHHLEKAFQELFCLPGSPMTRSNDFSNRAAYILQQVIPDVISQVRDNSGKTPLRVKRFLFDKLKFNDNSNNEFSDNYYVSSLMHSLCHALLGRTESRPEDELSHFDMERVIEAQAEEQLEKDAIAEFDRYRRMDEWSSSFQNLYSRAALQCQLRLMKANVQEVDLMRFVSYTRSGTFDLLRVQAFECLVELDIAQHPELLRWLMYTMTSDSSAYIRHRCQRLFGRALAQVAFGRTQPVQAVQTGGLIIEQESSTEVRQADLARRQTVPGAIEALKRELATEPSLRENMWAACNSANLGILELSELTDVCSVLFESITSKMVKLRYPRFWKVQNMGRGQLRFYRSSEFRTNLGSSKDGTKRKRDEQGMQPPAPRITFKHTKTALTPSTPSTPSTLPKISIPNTLPRPAATTPMSATPSTPASGGGLKLKLKFGQKK